jgi:hypothetical protein
MRHLDDTFFKFGAEKKRRPLGRLMIDVIEHEAEIARVGNRRGQRRIVGQKLEAGVKLPCAEAGLVKTLPSAGAPVENIKMLAFIVVLTGLGGHLEMRLDHIGDIDEDGGSALLAILVG